MITRMNISTRGRVSHGVAGYLLVLLAVSCGGGGTGSAPAPTPTPTPTPPPAATDVPFWSQWGFNAQHSGNVSVAAQALTTQLTDIVYDPFVAQEQAEAGGTLVAHYPATLVHANDFYTMTKTGTYVPCTPSGNWQNGAAVKIWEYASDWKPLPNGQGLRGWEPVFHPLLANSVLYVPGAGGSVWRVNKTSGAAYTPLSIGADGKIYTQNAGHLFVVGN